jgi:hypothetical protein
MAIFKNKFLDKDDYDKETEKEGMYIKNTNLLKIFQTNNDYKLAFVHILIPYAKKYYDDDGIKIPDFIKQNFKSITDENDPLCSFLKDYYKITNDSDDRIHKDEFLDNYNLITKQKEKWPSLLSNLKSKKIKYEKDFKLNGKRGVIVGIKLLHINANTKNV